MKTLLFLLLILLSLAAQAQAPTAGFRSDVTSGCAPVIVKFEDISSGSPVSWLWDFGNGATSTLQNPSTTYLTPGPYTVSLTVTNAGGQSSTVTKAAYIVVFDNPKVDFSATALSGCSPVRTQFADASAADAGNSIVAWEWDFGDGSLGSGLNPEHVYRNAGSYAVTLKVTDDKGCAAALLKPGYITVSGGIAAAFTNPQPQVCAPPASVTFTNGATGPGTLSYAWYFGDGGTSTDKNPTHTFNTSDTFPVTLVVRSSAGCFDTLTRKDAVRIGAFNTDFYLEDSTCPGAAAQLVNNSRPAPNAVNGFFPMAVNRATLIPSSALQRPETHW